MRRTLAGVVEYRGLANMGGVEEGQHKVAEPPAGLSSSEVNFLVYRYLLESGFGHAAFAFGNESDVSRIDVRGKDVPVGALVSFIQKGFQLVELEANLNANGTDVYGKYVQFSANDILTKDLGELRKIAEEIQDDKEKEEASPSKGGKKGKKTKRTQVEVSALEGANGVAVAEGALPPLEVEMDVDTGKDGGVGREDVDGRAVATQSPGSPGSPGVPRDVGGEAREAAEAGDVKDEGAAGVKSEVEEAEEHPAPSSDPRSPPQPPHPPSEPSSPPPPPPSEGEQMEVDHTLWEKQLASNADADDKNAPLDTNGVDTTPAVHEQAGT